MINTTNRQIISEMTHEIKTDNCIQMNWVELAVWLPYGENKSNEHYLIKK